MNSDRIVYTEAQLTGLVRHAASRRCLSTRGLPARNVLFRAEQSPRTLTLADRYVIIGQTSAGLLIGLGPDSGEVVAINRDDDDRPWHANADIDKFISSIEEFDDRAPFYSGSLTTDQLEDSAMALRSTLAEIDPTSVSDEGGFWDSLVFDVGLGDYSE